MNEYKIDGVVGKSPKKSFNLIFVGAETFFCVIFTENVSLNNGF